jgi:hypothetical protein
MAPSRGNTAAMRIPGVVRARFAAGAGTAIGPLKLRWAMADQGIIVR